MSDTVMCPYYDSKYKTCVFFDTYQEGYHKENSCLHDYNWRNCANYTNRDLETKVRMRLRPNLEL
jgi:hypothetical protein